MAEGTTIDKLQVELEATAKGTSIVFSSLLTQLSTLKSALNGLSATQITKIQKQLSSLSSTVSKTSSVSVNTSGMSKSEKDISNSVSKIKQSLAGLESYKNAALSGDSSSLTSFNRRVISIQSSVDVLSEKMKELGDTRVQSTEFVNLENQINTTKSKLEDLESQMQSLPSTSGTSSDAYTQLQSEIQTTSNELDGLIDKQNQMLSDGSAYTDPFESYRNSLVNVQDELSATKAEVSSATSQMSGQKITIDAGDVVSTLKDVSSSALKAAANLLKMSSSAIKNGFSSIKSKLSSIKSTISNITSSSSGFLSTGFGKILKYAFGIRSLYVLFRRLRTAIQDAFSELQNSGANVEETTANVTALKEALYTLKYQFGAAFEPIFNTVAPALETMINYLVAAMNTISAFIAKLTGASTYSKAVVTMNAVSDSAGSAADSTADLNKQLQGFDELNNLSGDSDSGSGGSGSSSSDDYTVTYVEESVESALSSFWNTLADYIEAGDWFMVGRTIANELTDALNSINWDSVWSTVSDWGTNLASFMNGLITTDLFSSIGTTIGNSLKTALTFLNSFGSTFDFTNFGNSIASGINAYIATNPLSLAVDTFNTWANGILDTLIAAISKIDWSQIATNIASAIGNIDASTIAGKLGTLASTIANALYTLVSNKDTWSNLGTKIGEGISSFFTSMSTTNSSTGLTGWGALGQTISNTITGLVTTITTALSTVDWEEVGQGIADFISNINWADITFSLAALGLQLKSAIKDLLKGLSIDAGDIAIAISAIGVTIAAISAVKLAASLTISVVSKLIEEKIAEWIVGQGGISVALSGASSVVATISGIGITIVAAIVAWKIGEYAYETVTGKPYPSGEEIRSTLFSDDALQDLFKGIALDLAGDATITLDLSNTVAAITGTPTVSALGIAVSKLDISAEKVKIDVDTSKTDDAMAFTNQLSIDTLLGDDWSNLGVNITDGVASGMSDEAEKETTWSSAVGILGLGVVTAIKNWFGIDSPAKTMYPYGEYIVLGIVEGIKNLASADTFSSAISTLKSALDTLLSSSGIGNVIVTVSATLGTTVTTLQTWGKSFVENISEKWTNVKSTVSAVLGGDIEDNGINTFTTWITAIGNLKSAWEGKKATFKAAVGDQISRITDLDSWRTVISNLTSAWQSKKAEFTAKYGSGTSENSINTMKTTISNLVSSWVSKASTYTANYANGTTESKITGMKNAISGLVGAWVSKDTTYKASYANGTTENGINGMKSVISGLTGAWVSKSASFSSTFNQTKETMQGYADAITAIKNNWTGASASFSISASIDTSNFDEIATTLANAVKTKLSGSTTYKMSIYKALGGILSNGTWKSIPQYAGGSLNAGSLFWAGEGGSPELVGHMNGRTEVLNKSQIASVMYASMTNAMRNFGNPVAPPSISANGSVGTYNANGAGGSHSDALLMEQNRLIAQQNVLLERIAEKDTTISASDIFSAMRVESNNYYNRTGNSAFIGF